jgi:preprotein translocase subunit YajC
MYTVYMKRFYILAGVFVSFFAFTPTDVFAVHLFLDADNTIHNPLDTFYVPVRIDTNEKCINAVDVQIDYNPTELSVKDVSIGDSVLTLWANPPVIEREDGKETGVVKFSGGIPGGYCGRVIGDPGQTNILAKLVISGGLENSTDEVKNTQLIIDPNTKVYLHDGKGTESDLSVAGVELSFKKSALPPKNVWMEDIKSDTVAPQLFDITLIKGPSEGNKRSYIIFNTTDKQSGIDHYEVLETDPDKFGFLSWLPNESYWVVAESPYVLRDQKLRSKIMVKAVDKNGNERVVSYTPEMSLLTEITHPLLLAPIVLIVIFVVLAVVLFTRFAGKRKKKIKEENEEVEDDLKEYEE